MSDLLLAEKRAINVNLATLPNAIKLAFEYGMAVAKRTEDGGACNFDTVILWGRYSKKREEAIEAAMKAVGGFCYRKTSGIYKGSWGLHFPFGGQGMRRTQAMEEAKRILALNGFEVSMYYAMD
jgi:hypothetical protein